MSEVKTKSAMLAEKREAWGEMGVLVYESELQLSAKAQSAIMKIKYPESFDEIPKAEALLKEINSERIQLEAERKEITGNFDAVTSRLMQPEKQLIEAHAKFKAKIVEVKELKEKADRAKQLHDDEIKATKQRILNYCAEVNFNYNTAINNQVSKAYEYALANDVEPEALVDYLKKVREKFTLATFVPEPPTFNVIYLDLTEVNLLLDEHYQVDSGAYLKKYHDQLDERFFDYHVAYKNKKDALALSIKEAAENQAKLQAEKSNNELAAKIEANATPMKIIVGKPVKALKKVYEIEMEETQYNAMQIIQAYVANMTECDKYLSISKWFSVTPKQMATALAKVKNADNVFQPEGIIFKEISKL